MKVKFFTEKKKAKKIASEIQKKVKNMLDSGQYTNAKYVREFENQFGKYFNAKYCVGVNNGTSALHLSLLALNIKKGDEIIVPSMTFIATAAAINYIDAKPVFIDVSENDWLINSEKIEKKINKKTKAILVVHLHGLMCEMEKIYKIAKKYKLKIIEDAAQAHGSTYKNKLPGFYSDAATFSFYPTKNLGAIGEGGAIITNNKKVYEKTKRMRAWSHKKDEFYEISYNYRMTEFSAISLLSKIKFLNSDVKKRILAASKYKKLLKIKSYTNYDPRKKKHSFHVFAIRVDKEKRDNIVKILKQNGIDTNIHYPYSLSKLKIFNKKTRNEKTPISNKLSKELLSLPIYPELTDKQIAFTAKILNKLT